MGFDDMSDEDKKNLLENLKAQQSSNDSLPENDEMPSIMDTKDDNDHYNSQIGSLGYNQQPSYASQHVPEDVSQTLNDNEANIDAQQDAKKAALDKLVASAGQLTPMNQKIAEGLGGMGSIRNIAMNEAKPLIQGAASGIMNRFGKNAVPLAERPTASFMQKAGESAPNFSSRAEQFAHMDNAAKTARFKAMELAQKAPYSTEAQLADREAFRLEQQFNKYKDMYKN